MNCIDICFEEQEITIQSKPHCSLMQICDDHPTPIFFGCREAACGTCLIRISSGLENLSPVTPAERELLDVLAPNHVDARLACQCIVNGSIRIAAFN
ncbi:2Fe-2S iron-sulfur cluster-binding protein [Leptolyngbya sp. 7M]|uniref:2Fe-2S iron-sulfur cluster-binding protein n=1 Tax=Leptolyngbya sp. 7M TaxID=2812896 RepID=UPI001B8B4193|nr:2Fe-2S iron-sulfur cluster-binding protein [Leptolyngbya sp. 7M]QYO67171.1 (2Fe-2S)-binding protein [Leptolyngbya sp. 7M]